MEVFFLNLIVNVKPSDRGFHQFNYIVGAINLNGGGALFFVYKQYPNYNRFFIWSNEPTFIFFSDVVELLVAFLANRL